VTTLLQLPPETAWLVPLFFVGILLSILVALVVLHFVRQLAEPDELRSRVESLEDEVAELRESEADEKTESQSNAD
jgi:membrane protein implicated in regulation of membrane protease activity